MTAGEQVQGSSRTGQRRAQGTGALESRLPVVTDRIRRDSGMRQLLGVKEDISRGAGCMASHQEQREKEPQLNPQLGE